MSSLTTTNSFFSTTSRRRRRGLSQPVAAIILVVIVTALALIVGVLTMARIGVFARSESIRVIEAQSYLQDTCIYVNAKVKNDGSTTIAGISVTARWRTNTANVGTIGSLQPGAEASASACVTGLGAGRGDLIVIEASGTGSSGTIRHSTSVPVV
ncbi:MAG: hypothetical protein QXD47_08745 [Candidatus Caldarchaeum sp.]